LHFKFISKVNHTCFKKHFVGFLCNQNPLKILQLWYNPLHFTTVPGGMV